jgi:hypothetical protein
MQPFPPILGWGARTQMRGGRVSFQAGDRVRIRKPESEYTGCRGTVVDDPALQLNTPGVTPLGYFVAIDGENGVRRPFLAQEIEVLRPAVVRRDRSAPRAAADEGGR